MDIQLLPRMIDISCVQANNTRALLKAMVELAKEHRFVCCFAMPCYTRWLVEQLKDDKDIAVGATIGFPSGADLTEVKVMTAKLQQYMGCSEFDMVINVGALIDQDYEYVRRDIQSVRDAVPELLMKVILEVSHLNDYEICKGSEIAAKCGVDYVKTGTGWGPGPTTVEHIKLIRGAVGDACKIKAAGGIRTLATIEEMVDAGCSRFGIGVNTVKQIMKEMGY